jgi:hypothetical protein
MHNHQINRIPKSPNRGAMSARNGDKSRHQINRKRGVLRRAKIRQMLAERKAAGEGGAATQPAKRSR